MLKKPYPQGSLNGTAADGFIIRMTVHVRARHFGDGPDLQLVVTPWLSRLTASMPLSV